MGKKLFVGNIGSAWTDSDLTKLFEAHGTVRASRVVKDQETGLSKRFGYVKMRSDKEALAAIAALNGQESGGHRLKVREARPRPESRPDGSDARTSGG